MFSYTVKYRVAGVQRTAPYINAETPEEAFKKVQSMFKNGDIQLVGIEKHLSSGKTEPIMLKEEMVVEIDPEFPVKVRTAREKGETKAHAAKRVAAPAPKPVKVAPKAPKAPAVFIPMYQKKSKNPRGYAVLTPDMVIDVFAAKKLGATNAHLAKHFNISESSVGTILSGPAWFKTRMTEYGRMTDPKWSYPEKLGRVLQKPAVKAPEKPVKPAASAKKSVAKPVAKETGSAASHKAK